MKLIILKDNLLRGVGIIEKSISEISHLPILQSVKLSATKENQLVLTGTNLETALIHIVSGKVEHPGEAAVSFRVLRDILKNLVADKIHLSIDEHALSLQADNYEASLPLERLEEFPIIPSISDKTKSFAVSAGKLQDVFQKALVATQYSEVRPEINGVYTELDRNELTCAGTDSFRLVEVSAGNEGISSSFRDKFSCIIPLRTAEVFLRVFESDEELNVFFDDNQVLFESAHTALISRLVDGTFPSYKNIIPHDTKLELRMRRKELESALKVTSVISGKTRDVLFSLDGKSKTLTISSRGENVGENAYRVPVHVDGELHEGLRISFNWKYILDGTSLSASDEVVMKIIDSHTPVVIRGKNENNVTYVVAPIRE